MNAAAVETEAPSQDPGKPSILIRPEEHEVVDEAIAALGRDLALFQRGGDLVHIVRDNSKLRGVVRPSAAPSITTVPPANLRERMAACAEWITLRKLKSGRTDEVIVHPPDWAVKAVSARQAWPSIRVLEGVIESPVLRPDGTVLATAGYDRTTGLLLEPFGALPLVPDSPTAEDGARALLELLEVVQDFPFETEAHKAAWVAAVLTPFARYAFSGPAPLFLIDANVRGCGKSKLADLVGLIFAGRVLPRLPYSDDDEAMGKKITAAAIAGDPLLLLDNVTTVGGSNMDAAFTSTLWQDRILGVSKLTRAIPLLTTWLCTGNNVQLRGDLARRAVHVRLKSDLENPEDRPDLTHKDLLAWVSGERTRLAAAALTLLRAWWAAGKPRGDEVRPFGSFEGWASVIPHALVWQGMPDPTSTREELAAQGDRDRRLLETLHAAWGEVAGPAGLSAREAVDLVANDDAQREADRAAAREVKPAKYPRLRDALDAVGDRPSTVRALGHALGRFRDRPLGGKRLVLSASSKTGQRWALEG